jgi:hypothetical protein
MKRLNFIYLFLFMFSCDLINSENPNQDDLMSGENVNQEN